MDANAAIASAFGGGQAQEVRDAGRVAAVAGEPCSWWTWWWISWWFFFVVRGRRGVLCAAVPPVVCGIYCLGAAVPELSACVPHGHLLTCLSFITVGAALLDLTEDGGGAGQVFFRSRTLSAGAFLLLWGASSIILSTVPDLSTDADHLLLSFFFLTVGVVLLILGTAGDGALPAYYGRLAQKMHDAARQMAAAAQELHDGVGAGAWWLPFHRRTFSAAACFILWGASSIILGAVPDLSTNRDHLLLCFAFLTVGIVLLILTVVAPEAADRLEGWLILAMP